ncbi:hypothetical protein ELUMI_v1c05630 [Williamsoniiplasma luminosum]|uniref:J domain-containing protein n=1 Tax=Williamsoniiplasma luminosum TaxID=214888 RepID=A0A2K8NU50_9MOLU|nr:J domain-containing protein [Williamsoniiplasma luminosum]ATZ17287.1 hypothetical protein ELUMI_v1c05630 [Williamsoniiplasma luminosum]
MKWWVGWLTLGIGLIIKFSTGLDWMICFVIITALEVGIFLFSWLIKKVDKNDDNDPLINLNLQFVLNAEAEKLALQEKITKETFVKTLKKIMRISRGQIKLLEEIIKLCSTLAKQQPIQQAIDDLKEEIENLKQVIDDHMVEQASSLNQAYQTLGIHEDISDQALKTKYRKLALKYHPDRNKTEEAKEIMTKINMAYDLIKQIRNLS